MEPNVILKTGAEGEGPSENIEPCLREKKHGAYVLSANNLTEDFFWPLPKKMENESFSARP